MLTFIPDIAEEHFEELQFLWGQRRNALRSSEYTMREMQMLEERIAAHVQGLVVLGKELGEFVAGALAGDDELPAFAAAYALLHLGTPGAFGRVYDALMSAEGKRLAGIGEALAHGPAQPLLPALQTLFRSAAPPIAVVAGEALAFHRALEISPEQLLPLLRDESAAVRAGAWRIAANVGVSIAPMLYESALRDEDANVQRAALAAAAWNAYPGWAPFCRSLADEPKPEIVEPLAMLAAVLPPQDLPAVASLVGTPALGPGRFRVAGAFGHPGLVDTLLAAMGDADPEAAAAAAAAFGKMMGIDVESDRRVTVPPPNGEPPDAFESEFQEEVAVPDVARARQHWEGVKSQLANSSRVCRGLDVSAGIERDSFSLLDMESRRELCLRARLTAGWPGNPAMLERFPLPG